jgi:hypothetical protein
VKLFKPGRSRLMLDARSSIVLMPLDGPTLLQLSRSGA